MVLFIVFGIAVLALLLMPEVFAGLLQSIVESPGLAIGLVAILSLILLWSYKRGN